MTVVCAVYIEGDGTWIGSDTHSTWGDGIIPTAQPKWHGAHGWAVGVAGDRFVLNLIEHEVESIFRKCPDICEATGRIVDLFEEKNINPRTDPGPRNFHQELLICGPKTVGRPIWLIGGDLGAGLIPAETLWAIGSGCDYAIGAGFALDGGGREKVEAAVRAAILYDQGCGGEPFVARLEDVAGTPKDSE